MDSRKKNLITIASLAASLLAASYLTQWPSAQAQVHAPMARAAAECVTYGSGSALQMCLHTFADGTKCVATGGGGLASTGAGAALQCSFR